MKIKIDSKRPIEKRYYDLCEGDIFIVNGVCYLRTCEGILHLMEVIPYRDNERDCDGNLWIEKELGEDYNTRLYQVYEGTLNLTLKMES